MKQYKITQNAVYNWQSSVLNLSALSFNKDLLAFKVQALAEKEILSTHCSFIV